MPTRPSSKSATCSTNTRTRPVNHASSRQAHSSAESASATCAVSSAARVTSPIIQSRKDLRGIHRKANKHARVRVRAKSNKKIEWSATALERVFDDSGDILGEKTTELFRYAPGEEISTKQRMLAKLASQKAWSLFPWVETFHPVMQTSTTKMEARSTQAREMFADLKPLISNWEACSAQARASMALLASAPLKSSCAFTAPQSFSHPLSSAFEPLFLRFGVRS